MNTGTTRHRPWAHCWGCSWAAVAVVSIGSFVRGEDDRAVDDVPPAILQLQEQRQANQVDLGAHFDHNVFQQVGAGISVHPARRRPAPTAGDGDQVPEASTLMVVRKLGEARLTQIDSACDITADQRRKLRLAMESDVRRLAEDIEAARRTYQGVQVNLSDQDGQRKWQQFQQDVQRYRQRVQRLFDTDSLLMKVLPTTLDSEQYARFTADRAARRSSRWRGLVAAAMDKFDNLLGLDQRQYDEIEKLLLEREPALRVDRPATAQDSNSHLVLVWLMLSEIDAQRLQGIVSGRQWQTLNQVANQGKAMRSYIEAQGLLEKVRQ